MIKEGLVKFIIRAVGHKCISLDGSRVYYWNVPMIVLPMQILSKMQKELADEFGNEINHYFYNLGKIQGINGSNILLKKFNFKVDENDLGFFLEQTNFVGIGAFKLLEKDLINNYYAKFKNDSSPYAKAYQNIYGIQKNYVCHYVRGLLTGATQAITVNLNDGKEEDLIGIETKCIAKGDSCCEFEIRPRKNTDKDLINEFDFIELTPEIKFVKEKETLSVLLRTVPKNTNNPETEFLQYLSKYKKEIFTYTKEGEVSVFDVKGLITPMDIPNHLFHILKEKYGKEKIEKMFYSFGVEFGRSENEQLLKRYPLQKNPNIYRMIIGQIGIYGLGKPEIVSFDTNNYSIIIRVNNSPGLLMRDIIGIKKDEFFDYFLAGFLAGVSQNFFDMPMTCSEYRCALSGHEACFFKISKN